MKNVYLRPMGKMLEFLKVVLMVLVMVGSGVKGWGQAILPISRTTWSAAPTGWTDLAGGNYTTSFACTGSDGGKFSTTGDNYSVFFNTNPGAVSFTTKSTATPTSCTLLLEESSNGTTFTTVSGTITLASTCTSYGPFNLLPATRYVKWTYTKSGSVNLTFDDVNITAMPCTPPTNPSGTITGTTPACTSTSLSYSAPSATSYWQTTATGTSTVQNTNTNYTATTTGTNTYYVREFDGTCWSTGSVASSAITINTQPATPATPSSVSIGAGNNTSFTATTVGAASYIWEVNTGSGYSTISNGGIYSNATTASLNLTTVPLSNNGYLYRATAVGASPCVSSAASLPATLTVTPTSSTTDYYRSNSNTTGAGGAWATVGNWQSSSDNATWITATLAPTSAANTIIIRNGHNITTSVGSQTADQLTIDAGATLTFGAGTLTIENGTGTDMVVNGTFTRTTANTLTTTGATISFNAGSIFNHASNGGQIPISTWDATSTCNITGMIATQPTATSFGQTFGIFNWNCTGQTAYAIIGDGGNFNPKGLMTVSSTGTNVIELESGGAGSTYNLDGGLTVSGGTFVGNYDNTGSSLEITVNITGNLIISGNGTFDATQGGSNATSSFYGTSINLTGDITISSSSSYPLQTSATNNFSNISFTGSAIQNYYRTSTTGSQYVDFFVPLGKSLSLQNSMKIFSSSATIYDEVFVDGTLNTNANAITQNSGTQARFHVYNTGTIITANTGGLVSAIGVGGTKVFDAGASYVFNAATTTPFPTGTFGHPGNITLNAAVVSNRASYLEVSNVLWISPNSSFTLTINNVGLAGTMTINTPNGFFDNGGENQLINVGGTGAIVINGKFITRDIQGFTGSNTAIPSIAPTLTAGCTIEYAYAGNQAVTSRSDYSNLICSNGGIKTTNGGCGSMNTYLVTVDNATTLDVSNNTFGVAGTNLTLVGTAKFINGGNGYKPDIAGIYTLGVGSTIEFSGTSATQIRISAPTYYNLIVSGTNVLHNFANGIKFQAGGSFTVKSGATFKLESASGFTNNTGSSATAISNVSPSNPTITLEPNSTIEYAGTTQTITDLTPYENLKISGSGVKTAPAADLSVNGNFTRIGTCTFNANASKVVFGGTSAQSINDTTGLAPIDFYNFHNKNNLNVIINNTIGVLNELYLTSTAKLNVNTGDVIMRSSASRTAYITDLGTTAASANITYGTGRFSVERYLKAAKAWRLLATPLDENDNQTITNSWREGETPGTFSAAAGKGTRITGPEGGSGSPSMDEYSIRGSMKSYNSSNNNYTEINTAAQLVNTIANKQGYFVFVRGDRGVAISGTTGTTNLRIKGKIRTGNQTFAVPADIAPSAGFESVGNPYASSINFKSVMAGNTSIVDAFIVWNPDSVGSYGVGKYETYVFNTTSGHYQKTPSNAIRDTIQSGEAVFLQNNSTTTAGSITIKESDKVGGSSLVSRGGTMGRAGVLIPTIEINLLGNNTLADGVKIEFDNSYSNNFDNLDVRKISSTYDNILIKSNAKNLVVERRAMPIVTDTIFLNLTGTRIASYGLQIDPSALSNTGLDAFLKDKFLQTETLVSLAAVTNINFDITADAASKAADRFMIVFKPTATTNFTTISANRNSDKTITINWGTANEKNINNYSIEKSADGINFATIGTQVATANNGGNPTYSKLDATASLAANWYRVKANNTNNTTKYSAIAMVAAVLAATETNIPQISIWPNPVVNKTLKVHFVQKAGNYKVQLVSANGKIIYTNSLAIASNNEVKEIALSKDIAAGKYELVVISSSNQKEIIPIVLL
ncbi:MAG: hypothetical protein ABL929_03280 [Ferruginibacter sp.]|nr:hypothetical protein [Ferruginibacter sp.]